MHKMPSLYYAASLVCTVLIVCEPTLAASKQAVSSAPLRLAQAGPAQGEFEGRYRVGNATCTVKPIKMAFEIRWAKGWQAMRFFFDSHRDDGKLIFVSEETGKGRDQFIFDDNRYDTGTFIRADGKVFKVSRIQR